MQTLRPTIAAIGMAVVCASWMGAGCGGTDSEVVPTTVDAARGLGGERVPLGASAMSSCELPCLQPEDNRNTMCGRLVDVETGAFLTAVGGGIGARCADLPPERRTGPCALKVEFYDALALAQNPTGTAPLPAETVVVNDCGHFMGVNIPTPALGYIGVVVDDADAERDDWVRTVLVGFMPGGGGGGGGCFRDNRGISVLPGELIVNLVAQAIPRDLDRAWTEAAGWPFETMTFSEKGAVLAAYRRAGAPVSGVQVTRDPAGVVEADDFYFSDTDSARATTVVPSPLGCEPGADCQSATGPNGAVLAVNCPLVSHAGVGGLPGECVWPLGLVKSIPGVIWTTSFDAMVNGSEEACP